MLQCILGSDVTWLSTVVFSNRSNLLRVTSSSVQPVQFEPEHEQRHEQTEEEARDENIDNP